MMKDVKVVKVDSVLCSKIVHVDPSIVVDYWLTLPSNLQAFRE